MASKDKWYTLNRSGGLRRFALAITVFNILGHTWFGFEQSWAQPLVGIAAAYLTELILELVEVWSVGRRPRFLGDVNNAIDFFLPAHISGLAVSMLLYSSDRLMPIAFAASVAIGSKSMLRVMLDGRSRHFLNPSNFGITITLLCFPWVGISPPYHFTENLSGMANWILPAFIICSGSFLNAKFTKRIPLLISWLVVFALQAFVRHLVFESSLTAALLPMTGVAFILFTFYMVTDPPTTPNNLKSQIAYGASVAVVYGLLMSLHIVFGLFFALTIVCSIRGLYLYSRMLLPQVETTEKHGPTVPVPAFSSHATEQNVAHNSAIVGSPD